MNPVSILLFSVLFTFIGISLGIITGLVPGIHVNTISFLIISSLGTISLFVGGLISDFGVTNFELLLFISMLVIGCLITHTFLDFIPSTFLGAPEGETALAVLPAHEMLLQGRGYEAVKASALGSFAASFIALLLILPARLMMGNPVNLYDRLIPFIPLILFIVIFVLIMQEGISLLDVKPKAVAAGLFLLSGFLGFIVLTPTSLYTYNWTLIEQDSIPNTSLMLFPMFTGLFGISNLLVSLMDDPDVPEQMTDVEVQMGKKSKIRGITSGTLSGGLVGWLPGITAAAATAVTRIFIPEDEPEETKSREYIMAVSAVDTSCAIFTLVALFVIMKARSGAMQAILRINEANMERWSILVEVPELFLLLLFAVVISSTVAYLLTLMIGKKFSTIHQKVEYNKLSKGIIVFLVIMMFVLSGPLGVFVGLVSTAIGVIPPLYGVKRVHLMGCIIFPIILFFTGIDIYIIELII
ncbi:MAG: tripartite tricarboxylate transporter permease [Candidatus Natronoplasma sp.]